MLARGTFRPVFVPKATAPVRRAAARVLRIALTGAVAFTMSGDVGAFVVDGQPAELFKNHHLNGDVGAFVLDGQPTEPVIARTMAADVGELAVDGQPAEFRLDAPSGIVARGTIRPVFAPNRGPTAPMAPQILRANLAVRGFGYSLTADVRAFVVDGQPADFSVVTRKEYTARGLVRPVFVPKRPQPVVRAPKIVRANTTSLSIAYRLPADVGALAVDGQTATFTTARFMLSDVGAFVVNGQPADLRKFNGIQADVGSFTVDGQAATFAVARQMPSDAGAFTVDGQPAAFRVGQTVLAEVGSFALVGQDATFRRVRFMAADVGAFVVNGQNAALVVGTLAGIRLRGRDLSGPLLASRDTSESYW